MPTCSFSSKLAMDGYTVIENTFFNEFLPQATGDNVKVYLYGLNLCSNPNVEDNSLDTISKVLSIPENAVKDAFLYWQDMGLVQVVSREPFEVRFLPVAVHSGSNKIRHKEKYAEFNDLISGIITGRMITPTEFNEYYTLIETHHFEPEAVLLIANYCVKLKNNAVGYPYILAVARSFEADGLKSFEAIEKKILEQEKSSLEIKEVLKALGSNRPADIEERNLYLKWTSVYGFSHHTILEIAKLQNKRGGFAKLDEKLTQYYSLKLFSVDEITEFSKNQEKLYEIAKKVSTTIGVSYQNYDNVVSTYVSAWSSKGYDEDALVFIAQFCFKQSLRRLEDMNTVVQKFFKLGLISLGAIEQYIDGILSNDEKIKEVLNALNLLRSVQSNDRDLYRNWVENWEFSHDIILKVAEIVAHKTSNMTYLSKVLGSVHEQHLTDENKILEFVKQNGTTKTQKPSEQKYMQRDLSTMQLSAVLDSLDGVEI